MLEQGDVINNAYEIIGEIGRGGVGIVYKARHLRLQKHVVVKQIKSKYIKKIDVRREADILKNLRHTYLPLVYDFLRIDDDVYTIIDFIPGKSIKEYIDEGYQFQQTDLVKWSKQLCEVLMYLHGQTPPIIHRDIKPANIMVTPNGDICLIDFNISLDDISGAITGMSDSYAAPEMYSKLMLFRENQPHEHILLDGKSDIYSLGLTLYHMVTGNKPKIHPQPQIPLEEYELPYSQVLLFIINKAMQIKAENRYQSAEEMYHALVNIKKADPLYIRLKFLNRISIIICLAVFLTGGLTSLFGFKKIGIEKLENYEWLIQEGHLNVEQVKYDRAIELYMDAQNIFKDKLDAYYEVLLVYAQEQNYVECIDYGISILNMESISESLDANTAKKADIMFIIANGYFERDDYENALKYYDEAVNLNDENPEYYRDYAIASARNSDVTHAKLLLDDAIGLGLTEDYIYLVKAEIALAEDNLDNAVICFEKSLSLTQNPYLRHRVYILSARAYRAKGNIDKEIEILEQGRLDSDPQFLNPILRALGEAYARNAGQPGADIKAYAASALDCYQQLADAQADTLNDTFNRVALYRMLDLDNDAVELLKTLQSEHPENYKIYANLALVYCNMESKKDNDNRDYTLVEENYQKAESLYEAKRSSGESDSEMQQLESIMQQLYDNHWLER